MRKEEFSRPIGMKNVKITDEFWNREQELVRTEVIPYQWEALNDRVEGASPSFCMHNFKAAGKLMRDKKSQGNSFIPPKYTFRGFETLPDDPEHPDEDKFYGFVFQDTDFSKWVEAVGYSLVVHPDPELERIADGAIDIVCAAQLENGYLDTYYIINGMDRAFTNLRDHHELYCLGHLIEGAVSYYEGTGKDKLLKAAMRFADYCADYFGEEDGKCKGYPGHEIAEMALARLYEVTGVEKYLKLSEFFINQRGQAPNYFEEEQKKRIEFDGGKYTAPRMRADANWFERNPYYYHQAHKPVRQQDEAVGHAVRAVYLYSGMADIARITQDESLYEACRKLWDNIVNEKLYITGGIGGTHMGEAFSFPYDLPNDTAYSETCAAIGLVFFARRMLEISPESRFGDVMELSLYNTVLAGMALDGKSFFYVNPLEMDPTACDRDERKLHVKPIRQKWFGCACCPPNIARTLSSLSMYAYTESEDTLYAHLYVGSEVTKRFGERVDFAGAKDGNSSLGEGTSVNLKFSSELPWAGKAYVKISGNGARGKLAFRIPGWSRVSDIVIKTQDKEYELTVTEGALSVNGEKHLSENWILVDCKSGVSVCLKSDYLFIDNSWLDAEISFDFDMQVEILAANNNVRECAGKVAVKRGPITYCMEEADNGKNLQLLYVDTTAADKISVEEDHEFGHKTVSISVPGKRESLDSAETGLYKSALARNVFADCTLKFIPYYAWNNRGVGEMAVWVKRY
ncbi:MAG: glycoside hydrolase family 127 protein [Butyrivibrio sp.]|nr:glycoside hydrolase family 127 protein [Butyrivibrio sp.]